MATLMQRVKGVFARTPAQGVGAVPAQQQPVFQQQPMIRPQTFIQQQPQYIQQPGQIMQQPQYMPQPQYIQQPPPQYVQQPPMTQYAQPQPQYIQQPQPQYVPQPPPPLYAQQQPQYVQQPLPQYMQQQPQYAQQQAQPGPPPSMFTNTNDPAMYAKNISLASATGLPLAEIERFRSEFSGYANPNGVIDRDGFRRIFIASLLNMTWQDIERESEASFRRFDTNQTGVLDFDEYVMACTRLSPSAAQQPAAPYQY